jgi:hypothetical protein
VTGTPLPLDGTVTLDFPELVAALRARIGAEICVPVTLHTAGRSRIEVVGRLDAVISAPHAAVLKVGDTMTVWLDEAEFEEATFLAADEGRYFQITSRFGGVPWVIGDPALLATDLSDSDSPLNREPSA